MAAITDLCCEATGRSCVICDFSPPRSGDPEAVQAAAALTSDVISVNYNPGRSVRADPAIRAASIRKQSGLDVAFTLATRDMNILALQSHLLGAQMLGLENVIVVQGDPFSEPELSQVRPVNDYRPSQLIAAIARMNRGVDFRGALLDNPTDFCTGGAVDLGRGLAREAGLAHRKVQAGARFLITQPVFNPVDADRFEAAYVEVAGTEIPVPVFYGLQIMEPYGVSFAPPPPELKSELAAGRSGVEFALELFQDFRAAGRHNIYLLPPIRRGGARDYAAAKSFLSAIGR